MRNFKSHAAYLFRFPNPAADAQTRRCFHDATLTIQVPEEIPRFKAMNAEASQELSFADQQCFCGFILCTQKGGNAFTRTIVLVERFASLPVAERNATIVLRGRTGSGQHALMQ